MGKDEIKEMDSRINLHIISYRHRLCDPDGISGKAAIDGLVHAKFLPDDSAKEIKAVTFEQKKIPSKEMEKTVIIGREQADE